jgi:hypothetical protein
VSYKLSFRQRFGILTDMAKLPSFQTTPESKKIIDDYYLATKAQEKLFDGFPSAEIKCKNAVVLACQPDAKHWVRRSMIKNASFREILSKKGRD